MSKPTSTRVLLVHTLIQSWKRVFVALLALVILTSVISITRVSTQQAYAAAPATLNFQARLLSSSGSLVPDGTYNMEFKIYNASTSSGSSQGSCSGDANCLWTESRTSGNKIEVKNGYLSAYLGDVTGLPSNIWNQQLWLTMNIGGTGSPSWDGEMTPRIRLTSVPYAFRATVADSAETLSKNTGSFTGTVDFSTLTANRTYLFPDTSLATTGSPGTICVFNGSASNCPAASGSAYYIQNDTTVQTQTNFNIQARDSAANGTIGAVVRGAAAGQTVDLMQFQATAGTVLAAVTATGNLKVAASVDTYAAGTLSIGTSTATALTVGKTGVTTTIAGALTVSEAATFNSDVTVAAGKYLRITGDNTAGRPASPTEGMLYFDTTTKQLLIYANGKWQADRATATKIVAPSNASQAVKDSADYVSDGTGDQVEINAALTAAAGGRVYLAEGTFVANATISIPNNTTLSGAGNGTVIELADLDATDNLIENTDTSTGTGVAIQDLRLDGRSDLNTAGTQYGVYFNGMGSGSGSSALQGAKVSHISVNRFRTAGLYLTAASNNTIDGNTFKANATGLSLNSSSNYNTIVNNLSQGNSAEGVVVSASDQNVLTGNNVQGNTTIGISFISGPARNTVTGNTITDNPTAGIKTSGLTRSTISGNTIRGGGSNLYGIWLIATSANNVVDGNNIYDTGSAGNTNGIYTDAADSNSITNNTIGDTSCTTTCYAINISNSTSDTNYIADNTLGGGSINDAGTGTVYGGQINVSGNYVVQPAGTIELMKNTNVTGVLSASTSVLTPIIDVASAGSLSIGTSTATSIAIGKSGVTTTITGGLSQLTGAVSLAGNAASSVTTSSGALTLTSAAAAIWSTTAGNLTVQAGSGTVTLGSSTVLTATGGLSITSGGANALSVDAGGAAALNLGTTNANAVSISKSGVTTTVNGALTVTQATTLNGGVTISNGGNVAIQRNTTDITATGTLTDLAIGTGALFRFNGASAQTLSSIASPADGRLVTIINAAATALTIQNDTGGTAANRIVTGTGASLSVPTGATIQLTYDSSASRWRVVGTAASSGGGANQQLSNLSGTVAVNASLTTGADNTLDLGSSAFSWRSLYADTSVLTPSVDVAAAGALSIGTSTATSIAIGKSGVTTTITGGLSQLTGAVSLAGNAASSVTTSSGALTLTSAAAAIWSTTAGNLTIQAGSGTVTLGSSTALTATGALSITSGGANALSVDAGGAAVLNLGTTNANAVSISKSGVTTTVNGALTVTQATTLNGGVTISNGGNIAIQRNTTDITTTGTLTDLAIGTGSLFRFSGASAQTLSSIASPADGRIVTIINAAATALTIQNDTGGTAANRIITGTGGSISVPAGATTSLVYDSSATRWRVVGEAATSGGGANQQLSNLSGTVAVNASLTTGADNTLDLGSSAFSWRSLYADTSVLTPSVDVAAAGALSIGTSTATSIAIGKSGVTTTITGGLSQLTGAVSLAGNAASSVTTSSGALTLTSAAAAIWSTTAGNLTIQAGSGTVTLGSSTALTATGALSITSGGANALSVDAGGAAALNLGTTNANAVSISKSGVTTTVNGALTVTQATTLNGGVTISNGGNVAIQRNTTDITTTGTLTDLAIGTGALFRFSGASAQTLSSIASPADGRLITIINAAATALTIQNDTGGTAANRIITGTAGDLSVPAGATVQFAYDSSATRWRVIGGTATAGGGANQQLSNLSGTVAINLGLTPNGDNTLDLGSSAFSWKSLYADTSVLTPAIDTATAGTLSIGTTTANAVSISKTGVTTTVNGALTVTQATTLNAGVSASGGAVSLSGNAASSLTTSTGALTITSAAAATWSTTTGTLTIQSGGGTVSLGTSTALTATGALGITSGGANALSVDAGGAAALNLGTTNANAVSISKTGVTTTVNGALTVTQATTLNGGVTISNGGNVAIQRNTTDITATGTLTDLAIGTGALFRFSGASAQTLSSVASPADGRIVTIINAAATALTIQNDTGGTAANRIITGTGGDLSVPAGATVQLAYDSSATRWRVIGGTATAGGAANQQLSNLSGTIAINASLTPNADNTLDLGSSAFSWRTLYGDTSVLTPIVDTATAAALGIGTTNATNITIGHNAGTFAVDGTNFDVSTSGVLTLAGGQSTDILTSGATTLKLDTGGAAAISIGATNANGVSIARTGVTTTVNGSLTVSGTQLQNNGSTLLVASSLGDFASDGPIGVNTATVDIYTTFSITQATTGRTLTLPNPTTTTGGRLVVVNNVGSTSFSMHNVTVDSGKTQTFIWNGTAWVSINIDRAGGGTTKIVAPSNASQALKGTADYVATGTADQTTINTALTAAAGGRVYLIEGTFNLTAAISVPNATTLSGAGYGTLITIPNTQNGTYNMIENTDQTTGYGVVIRDLRLDGNKSNQSSGAMRGVYLNNMGDSSAPREGAIINNIWVGNLRVANVTGAIELVSSNYNTLLNNYVYGNSTTTSTGNGIRVNGTRNNVTNNIVHNNGGYGISMNGTLYSAVFANGVYSNGAGGFYLDGTSNDNTINANNFRDNGLGPNNQAIVISTGNNNNVIANKSTDSSCTSTCYAIDINATAVNTFLSGNTYTGTAANAASINDLGVGTIYSGQADGSGNLINRSQGGGFAVGTTTANSSFTVQGGITNSALSAPTLSATVTNTGTTGATTRRYQITALDGTGETTGSTIQQTTTANATLSGSNYTTISWTPMGGAFQYKIYRCTGAACTPLLLTTVAGNTTSYDDIANGSPSGAVPSTNTTGNINAAANIQLAQGGNRTLSVATASTNVAGYNLTVSAGTAGSGASPFTGGTLTLQGGGAGGTGNANGGTVNISGGSGTGTGVQGLVSLAPTAFAASGTVTLSSTTTLNTVLTNAVNLYSTVPVNATGTGYTLTIDLPTVTTVGRILYLSAVNGSSDFTLLLAGTSVSISMKANSTATLIYNGTGWTAAGASSSTDLQAAYNNTLSSAGGAEIVLNASGGAADGLTIRNNSTTPIIGGLLEVQSSIGTNLFSVNNYATEFASNGGAETQGASSTTFPASTWAAAPGGGTVTREAVTSSFIATGLASVKIVTTAGSHGAKNTLSSALTSTRVYQVSFTAKLSSGSMSFLDVIYSDNGTTATSATCATNQSVTNSTWSKVTCTFTAAGTITSGNAIIIRQSDGVTRNIYVDNLSVTEISSTTTPSNVQIGGGLLGGQPTLFTLDRFSSAPVSGLNSTYYGSMYYDTTTNRIQCYEADGWGACGSAPDNIITLTPEYAGAVLNGGGVGTMTADFCGNGGGLSVNTGFCASGEARSYYKWTSPQATLQTYSIYVNYKLPATFKGFLDSNTIKLTGYRDDTSATNARVGLGVYKKSGGTITQCGSTTDVTTGVVANSWETQPLTGDETACGYAAGDYVIFKIDMQARSNKNVYVENLDFTFINT